METSVKSHSQTGKNNFKCHESNCRETFRRKGINPGSRWGSLQRSSDPLARKKGPLPKTALSALGLSGLELRPSRPHFVPCIVNPLKNPGYPSETHHLCMSNFITVHNARCDTVCFKNSSPLKLFGIFALRLSLLGEILQISWQFISAYICQFL